MLCLEHHEDFLGQPAFSESNWGKQIDQALSWLVNSTSPALTSVNQPVLANQPWLFQQVDLGQIWSKTVVCTGHPAGELGWRHCVLPSCLCLLPPAFPHESLWKDSIGFSSRTRMCSSKDPLNIHDICVCERDSFHPVESLHFSDQERGRKKQKAGGRQIGMVRNKERGREKKRNSGRESNHPIHHRALNMTAGPWDWE